MIESRVMLALRLFDKMDPNKLTLDIVEITAALEDELWAKISDVDSDHFLTPRHIIVTNMMFMNMLNQYPLEKNI